MYSYSCSGAQLLLGIKITSPKVNNDAPPSAWLMDYGQT